MARSLAAAVAAFALTVAVGACGDPSDDETSAASASTTAAPTTTAPQSSTGEYPYKGVVFTGKTFSGLTLEPASGPAGTKIDITASSTIECDEASLVAPRDTTGGAGGVVATTKTNFGAVTGPGSKAVLAVPADAAAGTYLVVADCAAGGSTTFGQEYFTVE